MVIVNKAATLLNQWALLPNMTTTSQKSGSERGNQGDYHVHHGQRVLAMAVSMCARNANGWPKNTKVALWCPVCGFKLTEAGGKLQLEVMERIMGRKRRK